jgi:AmmeMemoRadiSam system protein B
MYAIRQPKAAGIFYNSDRYSLERDIESFFTGNDGPKKMRNTDAIAVVTPHDRYHLCGSAFAWSFSRIEKANYVIIGPNHHGMRSRFSIMKDGLWKTPFGEVVVSNKVSEKILSKDKLLEYDVIPHENEHSIEVQLPFLQYRFGNDFKIVPILVSNKFGDKEFVEECKRLGKAIAHSLLTEKEKWILIGTTDFSHGAKSKVERVDKSIINAVKSLKEERLYNAVQKTSSRICGYGALVTMMAAAKELKAKKSRLLKYVNSMEVIKDLNTATGYASILIS